eukprot:3492006-Alexandrium_andersonii.AAC.1
MRIPAHAVVCQDLASSWSRKTAPVVAGRIEARALRFCTDALPALASYCLVLALGGVVAWPYAYPREHAR